MQNKFFRLKLLAFALGAIAVAAPTSALEIITEEDMIQGIVLEEQLVRVADNAIFLMDTSSSMNGEYRDTGKSKLETALDEFKRRAGFFPDLGHTFGIYDYTPWSEVYALQFFNRDKVVAALDTLPEKGKGTTPLAKGIANAADLIQPLSGQTAVFLFYDGDYTGPNADPEIWRLVHNNDACLIMVSSATDKENKVLAENLSKLNSCSRLIPLEDFLDRPEHMAGILFDVEATEELITITERKVVGLLTDGIVFGFDQTELTEDDKSELDVLAQYMNDTPTSYAVIAGYTDNAGVETYNRQLSRDRAEMTADYLMEAHGIDASRLVLHWYGSANPLASNDTTEGRAKNRRVEIAVSGI